MRRPRLPSVSAFFRPTKIAGLALPGLLLLTNEIGVQDITALFLSRGADHSRIIVARMTAGTRAELPPAGEDASIRSIYATGISHGMDGPIVLQRDDGEITGSLPRGTAPPSTVPQINRTHKGDLQLTRVERSSEQSATAADWFAIAFGYSDLGARSGPSGFTRTLPPILARLDPQASVNLDVGAQADAAPTPPARPEATAEAFDRLAQLSIRSHEDLDKAQRCLAEAIYFESRSEPERGQQAVAQVVLNRVKSGMYPGNVCDVVYQNSNWRNHCQFSFACDGTRERISDQHAWDLASRIADDAINGRVFLQDVGDATHYHATYVAPRWRRFLSRTQRIGAHIFYRIPGVEINSEEGS